jgi:hypothetical protein
MPREEKVTGVGGEAEDCASSDEEEAAVEASGAMVDGRMIMREEEIFE